MTTAMATRTKSVNDIMSQANRLMSAANAALDFKRSDAISATAFRMFDNIRAYIRAHGGRFNHNDNREYEKAYPLSARIKA